MPDITRPRTALVLALALVLGLTVSCAERKESALFERAMTALDEGLDGAAVEYLTQYLVRYPESERIEEVLYTRGTIFQLYQSRYLEAVSDFRELLDRFPDGSHAMDARRGIAEILERKMGNCRGAIVEYQRLISDYDTVVGDDEAQFRIARCFYNLMNFEQSKVEYRILVERYPASPLVDDAYFQIATVLQTEGSLEEAEMAWRRYLARYPEGEQAVDAKFGLASTLEEREELREALALYQEIFDDYENKEVISWRIEKVRDRLRARRR